MAEEQLPYLAEYSKSARASCKVCKEKIAKDVLRLAAMVQSPMFDGKVPNWYHYKCFFVKQRPPTVADIANFDSLRYEDQEKIKEKVATAAAGPAPTKGRGKGKGKAAAGGGEFKEFSVEVAKAGRAGCKGCEQKILKGEVRLSKMDYTSDSARQYGPMPRWHHIDCFLSLRTTLQFYGAAKDIPSFYALPANIQDELKEKIQAVKRKAEDAVDSAPVPKKMKKEDEALLKKQNETMFKFRDRLKSLTKSELLQMLEYNFDSFQSSINGEGKLLDCLCDHMTFGVPVACIKCGTGLLLFKSGTGYACTGDLTEFTRCINVEAAPKRCPFKAPTELAEKYSFLARYKSPDLGDRLQVDRGLTTAARVVAVTTEPVKLEGPKRPSKPLAGLNFVLCGKDFSVDKSELKERVKELGGKVSSSVTENTAAVITTTDSLGGKEKSLKKAEEFGIQCVSEDFLEEVKAVDTTTALLLIKKKAISDWGEDPEKRVSSTKLYSSTHKSGKSGGKNVSKYVKSVPDTLTLKLKNGGAVDPDSELSDCAHVLKYNSKLYNCVLGLVDIVKGTNSYYKLQLLESDSKRAWWVFRSWGRIGTTIGGNKLESQEDKQDAIRHFHDIFEQKTGNRFLSEFSKVPGRWTVLDIEYGESKEMEKMVVSESSSKLPLTVQELVALIFDVDTMKSQMMEFEIDLKKLPLGKLSASQLSSAFGVLGEAQRLLEEDSKDNAGMILDCSNRFYTLIPHDFGMNNVPMLDNLQLIKSKIEMVESLKEIEVAYSLLKDDSASSEENASVIDKHYAKLNTKVEPVDKTSQEFDVLQKYVKNTHASTHSNYSLELQNAFSVQRKGEAKRFKPFKKLANHKLLWHGSRITNFVGILSQGLRIAPPEAPATGYMFGKGIYFADMVSKSANYCCTSSSSATGLMLLCDVALGNMYERNGAEYVTKLSSGKHSTKGCGRTYPDPAQSTTLNGVEVPVGLPKSDTGVSSSLLYNEYIVYDVAQVETKYLLKLKFDYKI